MSGNSNLPEIDPAIPAGAVSVYGQGDPMDDFPVLKAFQQYVDAEHAKAQKRMTTLCIFFFVMMLAVIGVFVMLLMNMSQRNNSLSDQLLAYMMKDRDRAPAMLVPAAQSSQESAALKAVAESMAAMQREMLAQQNRMAEERIKFATEALARAGTPAAPQAAPAPVPSSPVSESERAAFSREKREHEKTIKDDALKLKRAKDQIKAEREKMAKERERLRQQELELQRRRLYPDLYERPRVDSRRAQQKETPRAQPRPQPLPNPDTVLSDEDLEDNAAIDAEIELLEKAYEDGAIRYFDDSADLSPDAVIGPQPKRDAPSDSASVPVNIGDTSSDWAIPLD